MIGDSPHDAVPIGKVFGALIEEGQVRTRLAAAGRWIRTIGTA
jgi:hypothetical protein